MRALVTGGAGYVGKHLVRRLIASGWDVVVIDDLSSGCWTSDDDATTELVLGSIEDSNLMKRATRDANAVFHLAGIANIGDVESDPTGSERVNVNGSRIVAEAAREAKARLIFSSSAAVYSSSPSAVSEDSALGPCSLYGFQKCRAEAEIAAIHSKATCLRFFNIYGSRWPLIQRHQGVVSKLVVASLRGKPLTVYGDGQQVRDYVFIDDVVNACMLAAHSERALGEAINVATGVPVSVLELVRELRKLIESPCSVEFSASPYSEIRSSVAAVEKSRVILGFSASVDIRAGLARTLSSFQRALKL